MSKITPRWNMFLAGALLEMSFIYVVRAEFITAICSLVLGVANLYIGMKVTKP